MKKYIVRLTEEERETYRETVRKLRGGHEKVRRAQILLQADADGPKWTDRRIAEAYGCRTKTVENIRQRFVLEGFAAALARKRAAAPPVPKLLDGKQEAQGQERSLRRVQRVAQFLDSHRRLGCLDSSPVCELFRAPPPA